MTSYFRRALLPSFINGPEGIKGAEAVIAHYKAIAKLDGDISAEVVTNRIATIIEEGKKLAAIHPIRGESTMIKMGSKSIKWFADNGIRTK